MIVIGGIVAVAYRRRAIGRFAIVMAISGMLALIAQITDTPFLQGNSVNREKVEVESQVYGTVDLGKQGREKISVTIYPRELSEKEATALLEQAKTEVVKHSIYLGKNSSPDQIKSELNLPDFLLDRQVSCQWHFSPQGVIGEDGRILLEEVREQKTVIGYVDLSAGKYNQQVELEMVVVPKEENQQDQIVGQVVDEIEQLELQTRSEKRLTLPTEISGHLIRWKQEQSKTSIVLLLGVVAGIATVIGENKEKQRKVQSRQRQLERQYPDFVSKLTILLGAGMSTRSALERIVKTVEEPLRSEILCTSNEMKQGVIETRAYKALGQRIGLRNYKLLTTLLEQNLRLGSRDLQQQLGRQVEEAYKQWEHEYEKAGERMSTAMLIPMMLLLGTVLFLVVLPALIGMRS